MSDETLPVVIERVAQLTRRVEAVETKLDAALRSNIWIYGVAGGAGAVLMILLPKVSKVLGLT
jgi:hypothetical protein